MQRVEQRLEIVPAPEVRAEIGNAELVKVPEPIPVFRLVEQLELPELCLEERLGISAELRDLLGNLREPTPPVAPAQFEDVMGKQW